MKSDVLFTPYQLGRVELSNRLVHSATTESMVGLDGMVNDRLVERYERLADGGVGLIIPGAMTVQRSGKHFNLGIGIYSDENIQGLSRLVSSIHERGAKVLFQLNHAGRQTMKNVTGQKPVGPSAYRRDPLYLVKPREMSEGDIEETIRAFGRAAGRAAEARADGVQIHAAHGYLVNQFLSPFFNVRRDRWGGSDENRFRFLKEIYIEVRGNLPEGMPVMVKLNANDFTPSEGVTPPLAAKCAGWLKELGIDGVEVSQGSIYATMKIMMGDVPVAEMVESQPSWKKPFARLILNSMRGKFDLVEGYNAAAAEVVRPALGDVPLILVGGMRRASHMEEVLGSGLADLISLSRPFIREPGLVRKLREGEERVDCVSCNRCFGAMIGDRPIHCYYAKQD